MNRNGHTDETCYFIGPEVEHTPAFNKKTLFVIGKQDVAQIERMAREYKTPHIFMGANHSFTCGNLDPYWDATITALLDRGFWVTLDYEAHDHGTVLKMLNKGIWQSRLFVPLLSVRIPYVQTTSTNLTIKIDDIDFNATNAGVWCLNHHEVTDSNRFTDWQDYTTDEVVAPLSGPVPNPVLKVSAPVYADINQPVVNLGGIKERVYGQLPPAGHEHEIGKTASEIKNDVELGLDTMAKSQLKPEPNETEGQVPTAVIETTTDVAEVYAAASAEKAPEKKAKAVKVKA